MPDPASLRSLLAAVLASRGVDVSALSIPLSNEALGRVWGAFCAFAAEPVQDLYPNLTVPGPGRSDTDRLSFQFTPERPATRNSGPRPPSAWLSREVYLVDVDGEWLRSDDAALRLDLDRRLPDRAAHAVYAAGGADTAATWARQVEGSPLWSHITAGGVLGVELE
jgi:hypothetical protein